MLTISYIKILVRFLVSGVPRYVLRLTIQYYRIGFAIVLLLIPICIFSGNILGPLVWRAIRADGSDQLANGPCDQDMAAISHNNIMY